MIKVPACAEDILKCRKCGEAKRARGNFYSEVRYRKSFGVFTYYRPRCVECVKPINLRTYYLRKIGEVSKVKSVQ